jgi:hypothetical protein
MGVNFFLTIQHQIQKINAFEGRRLFTLYTYYKKAIPVIGLGSL